MSHSWQCCFAYPKSPKVILLAKSARRTIDIRHQPESRRYQWINSCETDFASSIKSADEPRSFPPVGNLADRIRWTRLRCASPGTRAACDGRVYLDQVCLCAIAPSGARRRQPHPGSRDPRHPRGGAHTVPLAPRLHRRRPAPSGCPRSKARQSFLYISAELTRLTLGACARSAARAGRDGMQGSNTYNRKCTHPLSYGAPSSRLNSAPE